MNDGLPPRHVLDAWAVPPVPATLVDATMLEWETRARLEATPAPPARNRALLWWAAAAATVLAVVALATLLGRLPGLRHDGAAPPAPGVVAPPRPEPRVSVVVSTEPADAVVRVDGAPMEGPTPHVSPTLRPGLHWVRVDREGFLPYERRVEVGTRGLQLSVQLEPEPAAEPEPEEVAAPTPAAPRTSPDLKDPFRRKPGKPVPVKPKKPRPKLDAPDLSDPFAKTGSLVVAGAPGAPPATVVVDGRKAGKTPVPQYRVAPGSHVVECHFPDGTSTSQRISVKAGGRSLVRCRD